MGDLRQAPPGAKRAAGARYPSEIVAEAGEELFGSEWAAPMARLTDTNERTVRRVRQAAREGRDYPAARGLLAALSERLAALARDLGPFRRRQPPPAP
ncbi:hypothetical protein [Phenylobacterium sp.]|uniref:hypothetical protein n=1 Tax=Phenylobacterium sp. TaxID=1871053 RepID=UPI002DE9A2A4|nr:hypothetical protein [Phenylobacterium sp.]